ncbi:hypothetical protein LXL04_021678 [Taraxacum kok-saghyz]
MHIFEFVYADADIYLNCILWCLYSAEAEAEDQIGTAAMVEDVDEAGADRGEPAVLPDQRTGFTKVGNRWSWNRRTIPLRSSQIDASVRWRRSPMMEKALEEVAGEGAGDGEGASAEIGREGAGTLKREGGITRWFLFSSSSVLLLKNWIHEGSFKINNLCEIVIILCDTRLPYENYWQKLGNFNFDEMGGKMKLKIIVVMTHVLFVEMIKYNTKRVCHRITHSQPIIYIIFFQE